MNQIQEILLARRGRRPSEPRQRREVDEVAAIFAFTVAAATAAATLGFCLGQMLAVLALGL